ncbi:hypothetical protein ACLNGM_17405 [Aureimonas phyllosphaerae]|uniref:hypothetical protein n=1 Tax=Aureimonas phyllosphaerae TaxID=1166078 RepID=UPI003A5C08E1
MLATLSSALSHETASRLRRMLLRSNPADKRPLLTPTGLSGYGDAGDFARQLVADIALFKNGNLPWRDVDSRAVFDDHYGVGAHDLLRCLAAAAGLILVELDWPHLTLDRRDRTFMGTSRCTLDGAADGASALLALHIPVAHDGSGSPSKSGEYWLAQLSEFRETVGCPIVIVCQDAPCSGNYGSAGGVVRIGFPDAADLSKSLSDALYGVLSPSNLVRSIRHLEGVATARDMAALARRIRRRARLADRPVRPEDVDAAAFEDVRPAAARLMHAVHAAGAATSLLLHGRIPAFISIAEGAGRRIERYPHMRVDHALISMLAGCAAEEVLLGVSSINLAERKRLVLIEARRLASLSDSCGEDNQSAKIGEDDASDVVATRLRYAYGDATALVREHSLAIGSLAADLIDRITLRSTDLADFARSHGLVSDESASDP